jgi:hypothetical protein
LKTIPILISSLVVVLLAGCGAVFVNKGSVQEPLTDGLANPEQNRPKIAVPHEQEVIGNFDDGSTSMNPQLYKAPSGTWSMFTGP